MNDQTNKPDANEPPVNLLGLAVPDDAHSHVDEAHDEWLAGFDAKEREEMAVNKIRAGMKL